MHVVVRLVALKQDCIYSVSGITVTWEGGEGVISKAIQATSSPRCSFVFFGHGSSDFLVAKMVIRSYFTQ